MGYAPPAQDGPAQRDLQHYVWALQVVSAAIDFSQFRLINTILLFGESKSLGGCRHVMAGP